MGRQAVLRAGGHVDRMQSDVRGVWRECDHGRGGAAALVPVRQVCKRGRLCCQAGPAASSGDGRKLERGRLRGRRVDRGVCGCPVGDGQAGVANGQDGGRVGRDIDAVEREQAAQGRAARVGSPGKAKVEDRQAVIAAHSGRRVPHGRAGAAYGVARLVVRVVQVPQRAGDVARHARPAGEPEHVQAVSQVVRRNLEVDCQRQVVVPQRRRPLHGGGRKVGPSVDPRAFVRVRAVDPEVPGALGAGARQVLHAGQHRVRVLVVDRGGDGLGAVPRVRARVDRAYRHDARRAVVRRAGRRGGIPPDVGLWGSVAKLGLDTRVRIGDRVAYPQGPPELVRVGHRDVEAAHRVRQVSCRRGVQLVRMVARAGDPGEGPIGPEYDAQVDVREGVGRVEREHAHVEESRRVRRGAGAARIRGVGEVGKRRERMVVVVAAAADVVHADGGAGLPPQLAAGRARVQRAVHVRRQGREREGRERLARGAAGGGCGAGSQCAVRGGDILAVALWKAGGILGKPRGGVGAGRERPCKVGREGGGRRELPGGGRTRRRIPGCSGLGGGGAGGRGRPLVKVDGAVPCL